VSMHRAWRPDDGPFLGLHRARAKTRFTCLKSLLDWSHRISAESRRPGEKCVGCFPA